MRFRQPDVAFPVEFRWCVGRAFGPAGAAAPTPVEAGRVVEMAVAFDLASRIGSRNPAEALTAELGKPMGAYLALRARDLDDLTQKVAALAAGVRRSGVRAAVELLLGSQRA